MQRITPDRPWPLLDAAATRAAEQAEAALLPPHTLMRRAGLAVARLTMALAPHAKTIGAFQGANYDARAFYRPAIDCVMFTRDNVPFCPVCSRTIQQVIDLHT